VTVGWKRCDLHVHTRYSAWTHLRVIRACDACADPEEMADRALAAGMDYVAITDHDTIEGALRLRDARPDLAPVLIVGEEVETFFPGAAQWVHVGVHGIDETDHAEIRRLRGDVRALVAWLRSRRLLYVLNHPFQSFRFQKTTAAFVEEILELFPYLEVGNGMMSVAHRRAAEALVDYAAAIGRPRVAVGGSDAHAAAHVGTSWTTAPGATPREWLESLARGECRFASRPLGLGALLGQVHRAVGGYYAGLATPAGRRRMTTAGWIAAAALLPGALCGVPAALTLLDAARQRAVSRIARRRIDRAALGAAVGAPLIGVSTGTGAAPPAEAS
jgi:predicted metal-dependent phosphoesterase TrpH